MARFWICVLFWPTAASPWEWFRVVSQGVKIQNETSCHRFQINCFRIIYGSIGIIGIIIRSVSSELNAGIFPFSFPFPCLLAHNHAAFLSSWAALLNGWDPSSNIRCASRSSLASRTECTMQLSCSRLRQVEVTSSVAVIHVNAQQTNQRPTG